jgi:hypothetical protein
LELNGFERWGLGESIYDGLLQNLAKDWTVQRRRDDFPPHFDDRRTDDISSFLSKLVQSFMMTKLSRSHG